MSDSERSYSGTVVAALLLSMMIAGVTYRYWPSDERSIRRHLSNLAEALSFPLAESGEERLTRVAVLREYFAPDVRVEIDGREITSRDEIIGLLSHYQPPPGGLNVEFALRRETDEPQPFLRAPLELTARVRHEPGRMAER